MSSSWRRARQQRIQLLKHRFRERTGHWANALGEERQEVRIQAVGFG
jgi:hypothetical protein